MSKNLEGKVVVVIGASSGIGEGIARAVAEKNPRALVLAARRGELLEKIARTMNCETFVQKTDVTEDDSIKNLISVTKEKYDRIDAVINSAGVIQKPTNAEDLTPELINLILGTNLRQALIVAKNVSQVFKEQRRGIYLVISSQAGRYAFPGETAYCASKAGVEHMIRALDLEWRDKGIYAFSIGQGFVDTEEAKKQFPEISEETWKKAPIPIEFGRKVIEYLLKPADKYLENGAVHHVETLKV